MKSCEVSEIGQQKIFLGKEMEVVWLLEFIFKISEETQEVTLEKEEKEAQHHSLGEMTLRKSSVKNEMGSLDFVATSDSHSHVTLTNHLTFL